MRRSNAPTLQNVADEAGVSAMMASVVLNGANSSTRVSEKTRARILEAAARLGYRRNAVARGLARQLADTIGVVAVIDGGELNLYFLEILNGILEGAAKYEQNMTVFSISDWKADENRVLQFCDGRVDGMILIAPTHIPAAMIQAIQRHTPFITIHSDLDLPDAHNLDVDNEGGAYAIVRYLLFQGHRRIAHFTGTLELKGAQQRFAGYRRALEEAGVAYDDALVIRGHYSFYQGRHNMTELLARHRDDLPTAIFCASDAIAYGCMEAMAEHGLRVPDDISIVGFDDTLIARMTTPALTTVRQPFRQMGRRAVARLLPQIRSDMLADETSEPAPRLAPNTRTEILPVELVFRRSVGPPRA